MLESNLYVFYGTETFLIQEKVDKLIKKLIPLEERDLNVIYFDLTTIPIEEIVQEAEILPFASEHKLIIVKNSLLFTGRKGYKSVEHDVNSLETYLDNPVDYSTIIFWVPYNKLDERRKIVKKIKKKGTVQVFEQLSDYTLIEWVKKTAENHDAIINEDAAKLLIQIVGKDLQMLNQEINKMAIYVESKGTINIDVVNALTVRKLEDNIFMLIELVANLEFDRAFQMFYDLMKNKEEPIKMVALFARQFRLMLHAKEFQRIGYSERQIAEQLRAHPYAIKIALQQSRRFSEEHLKEIMNKLSNVDYQIKSGQMEKVLVLEMFFFYLKSLISKE